MSCSIALREIKNSCIKSPSASIRLIMASMKKDSAATAVATEKAILKKRQKTVALTANTDETHSTSE